MDKQKVKLICDECLSRNYSFTQNKNKTTKLVLKKYCSNCAKHTMHKETR